MTPSIFISGSTEKIECRTRENQKIAKIASNLKPTSNNPNGQTNDEFNRGQMPEFKKLDDNYPDLALGVDGAIKKETKRKSNMVKEGCRANKGGCFVSNICITDLICIYIYVHIYLSHMHI